jgi:hypothetical protein
MLERCSLCVAPDGIESTFKHDELGHPTTNPANASGVISQEGHCNSYQRALAMKQSARRNASCNAVDYFRCATCGVCCCLPPAVRFGKQTSKPNRVSTSSAMWSVRHTASGNFTCASRCLNSAYTLGPSESRKLWHYPISMSTSCAVRTVRIPYLTRLR